MATTITLVTGTGSATYTVSTGARGPSGAGSSTWNDLTGTANHIPFDTTPTAVPTTIGTLAWSETEEALEVAVEGGAIALGKETFDYFTNLSGVAMVDGDIVSIVGATGNRTAVDLTDATDATSSANVIGMVTHGAANNGTVRVTKTGSVHSLNTDGLTEGGTVYVDPALPGKWTMSRPTSPNHVVSIGFVQVAHLTNGVVDVVPNHQCVTAADIVDKSTTLATFAQGALADSSVQSSQLSTTGGANKVAQFDSSSYLRTGAVNGTGSDPGGGIRIPARQRLLWERADGQTVANVWMFDTHGSSHDANLYPELVWSSARHCYYWDDGFQMGNSASGPGQRGWRFLYFNPLGQACAAGTYLGGTLDTQMESIAVQFGGSWWNGSAAVNSTASIQYVPDGTASGELGIWIGGSAQPGGTSARGRILESSGHTKALGITPAGPVLPSGRTFTAAGDFTLAQNSAIVVQSDKASALANTLRITNGKTRIGASGNLTGIAAFPFEVAVPVGGITQTTGDIYVDTNGTLFVGRLSSTSGGGSGKQIWQGRTGVAQITFDAGGSGTTPTATFATLLTSTSTTDASSSAGAIKTSGGISAAKGIYLGTILTGTEQASEPSAPAANGFVIYAIDNGGKTQLMVKFATGAAQQLAIEP